MKKYYFLMALAATAIMSACSTENEFTPQTSGAKVNFYVDNGPITRTAVNTGDAKTTFVANDKIGIFATGGATASNVGYKVADGTAGTLEALGTAVEWTKDATGDFYAYYPYAAGTVTGDVTFTVGDQTDATSFNKNDFMVATKKNIAKESDIKFTFAHGLSLVKVVLAGDKAKDITNVILTVKPTVKWAYATNAFATDGTATEIKMWQIATDAQEYWAVVPAQSIATGTEFVKIVAGGKNYTYKPTADITLDRAHSKKFTLTLGEAGKAIVVATDIETDGWEEDVEETGKTEEEKVPAVELISADAGKFTSETPLAPQTAKEKCAEGWNYIMSEANGTVAFDGTDALAITKLTTGGASWYNGTIYYCTKAGKATKAVYELKFKMKSTAGNDIQIAVMPCLTDNYYFQRVGMKNSYVYQTATETYVEYTFQFDLSKLQTTANSESTAAPTAEQINKILVYFTPKSTSESTFYIKDVTFIEVKE